MTGAFTLGRRRDNPQCGHNESTGVDETPVTEQIIRSLPTVYEQRLFCNERCSYAVGGERGTTYRRCFLRLGLCPYAPHTRFVHDFPFARTQPQTTTTHRFGHLCTRLIDRAIIFMIHFVITGTFILGRR